MNSYIFMGMEDIDKLIGMNLRKLRQRHRISQEKLAQMIDTPSSRISAIENGSTGMGKDVMLRVCRALKARPWEFYIEADTPCLTNPEEVHQIKLYREAVAEGIAEDITRYGTFRISEAKRMRKKTNAH